jgi:RNA polymerase sigma factor for flagellar operon FliA
MSADSSLKFVPSDDLIAAHQGLVVSITKSIQRRVPRQIPYEDLLSYGQLGLVQAARTYLPVEGSVFATFAHYRITGAIYEGLTRMNWTSRAEYRRRRAEQAADDVLRQQADTQNLEPANLAGHAGGLARTVSQLSAVFLISELGDGADSGLEPAVDEPAPSEQMENQELVELVRAAIAGLTTEEQQLIHMVYFDDCSLAQAAQKLGKSRSWASRSHGAILQRLTTRLGDPRD